MSDGAWTFVSGLQRPVLFVLDLHRHIILSGRDTAMLNEQCGGTNKRVAPAHIMLTYLRIILVIRKFPRGLNIEAMQSQYRLWPGGQ